jgi:hypothetical protein
MSFTYELPVAPGEAPSDLQFGALWQVGLEIIENNSIELGSAGHPNTYAHSVALPFYGPDFGAQYNFRNVIARNNVIRLLPAQPAQLTRAVELTSTERAIMENNVVDLPGSGSMTYSHSRALRFFNNQTPSGALVNSTGVILAPSFDKIPDALRTQLEDMLALGL